MEEIKNLNNRLEEIKKQKKELTEEEKVIKTRIENILDKQQLKLEL